VGSFLTPLLSRTYQISGACKDCGVKGTDIDLCLWTKHSSPGMVPKIINVNDCFTIWTDEAIELLIMALKCHSVGLKVEDDLMHGKLVLLCLTLLTEYALHDPSLPKGMKSYYHKSDFPKWHKILNSLLVSKEDNLLPSHYKMHI
jgi:hypothetical protein